MEIYFSLLHSTVSQAHSMPKRVCDGNFKSFLLENTLPLHRGFPDIPTLLEACFMVPYVAWLFLGLKACHWFTESFNVSKHIPP